MFAFVSPGAPASPPTPPAPPGPQDARLTPDAPASSPAPPSRTAAGKTELVELFLGTPAGRALVNVGDEVRDAAPRVGRLDERVGVPTSFFLAAAADPTSRERPAPFPPSFLTPRRPALRPRALRPRARSQADWAPIHSTCSAGHVECLCLLLAAGADPDRANQGGQRGAHYAASKGRVDALVALRKAGADLDARDKTGSTPLHRAASQGRVDVIQALLDANGLGGDGEEEDDDDAEGGASRRLVCDAEARNRVGQTPLVVACEAGMEEAALALARRGADVDAEDDEGNGVATLAPKLVAVLRSIRQGDEGMTF